MVATTIGFMAKATSDGSDKKRVSISFRIDPDLLEKIDTYCESQDIPLDRTAFLETAARKLLELKLKEQKRCNKE